MTRFISPREDVKLLVVSVPEDAENFDVWHSRFHVNPIFSYETLDDNCDAIGWVHVDLPPGRYIPLGIATELREEVTRELVDSWDSPTGGDDYQDYYRNYTIETPENYMHLFHFVEPNESWHSFLRREGITERVYVLRVKESKVIPVTKEIKVTNIEAIKPNVLTDKPPTTNYTINTKNLTPCQ